MHTADQFEYSALSDRMAALLMLRLAMATIVAGWALLRPEVLGIGLLPLLAVSGGTSRSPSPTSGRAGPPARPSAHHGDAPHRRAVPRLGDVRHGRHQSPLRFLLYLHLVAVSLLASYRTGLKLALWDSLLLLVVLYGQAAQLVPAVDVIGGTAIEFERMPFLNVMSFWLFALATSVFSAMNERELRHRRADLQTIVDIGARLDDMSDPIRQSVTVLEGLAERFGFQRGADRRVRRPGRSSSPRSGPTTCRPSRSARTPSSPAHGSAGRSWRCASSSRPSTPSSPRSCPGRNILDRPDDRRRPSGRRHRGRASVGHDPRRRSARWRSSARCAIAALNLRNAVLLRDGLAERDPLTGAANRRMFQVSLERILAIAERAAGSHGGLVRRPR